MKLNIERAKFKFEKKKVAVEKEKAAAEKKKITVEKIKLKIERSRFIIQHEILMAVNCYIEAQKQAMMNLTNVMNNVNQNVLNITVRMYKILKQVRKFINH